MIENGRTPGPTPPYVRNAPMLSLNEVRRGADVVVLNSGSATLELRVGDGPETYDLAQTAYHLTTTWNFHDPLVETLRAILERPSDRSVLDQARHVLDILVQSKASGTSSFLDAQAGR